MGELVQAIFSTFSETMTGLSSGLVEAFNRVLYVYEGTTRTEEFNPLVLFIFTVAGIGLGASILWRMFSMIKGTSNRAG